MLFIIGLLLIIAICNDTATLSQVFSYALLGFALMTLYVLLSQHQQYHLVFTKPNGKHIKVRTKTLLAKLIAQHKYNKLGYTLHTEWEVSR